MLDKTEVEGQNPRTPREQIEWTRVRSEKRGIKVLIFFDMSVGIIG